MTISHKQQRILEILDAAKTELYGLEIVKRSHGKLGRGTVYVHLERLEDLGYVSSREENKEPHWYVGLKRRLYRITEDGRRVNIELSEARTERRRRWRGLVEQFVPQFV